MFASVAMCENVNMLCVGARVWECNCVNSVVREYESVIVWIVWCGIQCVICRMYYVVDCGS